MLSKHWLIRSVASMLIAVGAATAQAATKLPEVHFDVGSAVACRDVTPPAPASIASGEKLIEARFRVSILVESGRQEDIEDVVLVVQSPERRLRVVDFLPKTELADTVEGEIEIVHTTENTTSAGGKLGGGFGTYGLASAELSAAQHHVVNQKYKEMPSKCLVLASGTTQSEHGVFFKIKGSPRFSLEGAKEFTCLFAVPKNWKGDWCVLSCQARALTKHYFNRKLEPCGRAEFVLGLYLDGNSQGQAMARRLERLPLAQSHAPAEEAAGIELALADPAVRPRKSFDASSMLTGWTKLFEGSPADTKAVSAERDLRRTLRDLGAMAGY